MKKSIRNMLILCTFICGLMSSSIINQPIVVKDNCKVNKTLTYDNKQIDTQRVYTQYEVVVIANKVIKHYNQVKKHYSNPVQEDNCNEIQDVESLTSPIPVLTITSGVDVSNIHIDYEQS